MIASVEGVLMIREQEAVVQTGGLGLRVMITEKTVALLPAVGETVRFWTHLNVREDGWTLFGFLDKFELLMFRLLITVNGIGPKVALGILSGSSAARTARMIQRSDEKGLRALPGIGPKSAARMVIELAAKIPVELLGAGAETGAGRAAGLDGTQRSTALDMLKGMGLNPARAEKILDETLAADADLGEDPIAWVKRALSRLN